MNRSIEIIESMHEKEAYCIDIFPFQIKSSRFFEVERIYLKRNLKQYAKRVANIVAILWGMYETEIYLTEFPLEKRYKIYSELVYTNIADIGLDRICDIVETIINEDISSMEILIPSCRFEISIGGEFNTIIYNISDEYHDFISSLVEHEQLYLRKCED